MRTARLSEPQVEQQVPVEQWLLVVAGDEDWPAVEPHEQPVAGDQVARVQTDRGALEFVVRGAAGPEEARRAVRLRGIHDGWRVRSLAVQAA